jgi:ribosome-associated protein
MPLVITSRIVIPDEELELHFVRSSGPGGQNVQKVSSAVQLRMDVARSPSLPEAVKQRVVSIAGRRMTSDGVIIIIAQRHRTQLRNREDALARLVEILKQAAAPPPPARRPTKPTRGSVERRLASKSGRSAIKVSRSPPKPD